MSGSTAPSPCPACGAAGTGAFCIGCGAARDARWCTSCGAAIPAGGRFCNACGTAAASRGTPPGGTSTATAAGRMPGWIFLAIGGTALVAVLALVWPRTPTSPPQPVGSTAGGGGAAAIDLSTMTPKEQFDRLYERVMRAAENGDDGTVTQFAPMALGAYSQLLPGDVDADARYHAAMIRMHTGDPDGAAALADTIRAEMPDHLFSYVIHGTLARQRGDQDRLAKERAGFLQRYDAEIAANRLEYGLHTFILDQFVGEARGARGN
ncbi:MAG: zinc ribbon domain-containing protein [Gemmatimonadales bacterium]|nr:zinc ribbon domain-containing protein [Gemmatimonadales bacterium]